MNPGHRYSIVMVSAFIVTAGFSVTAFAQGPGVAPTDNVNIAKNLTYDEMHNKAAAMVTEMQTTLDDVVVLRESTREKEKDVLKLNCINVNVSSMKGFVKVSEQSVVKLDKAIAKKDRDTAEHQFYLVTLAGDKVSFLAVKARSCAGDVLRYSGETVVTKDISGDIAAIDPTDIVDEEDVLFATEEATPYQ